MLGVGVGVALPYTMLYSSVGNNHHLAAAAADLSARLPADESPFVGQPSALNVTSAKLAARLHIKDELETNEVEAAADAVSFVGPSTPAPWQSLDYSERIKVSSDTVRGIYWSQDVEDILPKGFDGQENEEWNSFSRNSPISRVEEGCGRMQNRLIAFENGRQSCVRYRQNYDQIQGEIFSYYLGQLMGLRNLPPSSLAIVRPKDRQWANVQSSILQAQWAEDRPVVHTQFLNGLEPAYIPAQLRGRNRHLNPLDVKDHQVEKDRIELIQLAQWSDLLVFDYLTANLDRMVNNLHNMQWNPAMMDAPAHNLARDTQTGLLVFLDNESGLLHGYRLLDKYELYHKNLLDSLCLFRKSTVDALRRLQGDKNVGNLLRKMFERRDQPAVDYLPFLPEKSIKILNYRIDQVLDRVTQCESLYSS